MFAGTGALGIEAVSRGAKLRCSSTAGATRALLRNNVERLGLAG